MIKPIVKIYGSKRMNRPYVYGCPKCNFTGSFDKVIHHIKNKHETVIE